MSGGGLLAGISVAVAAIKPSVRLVGVEPEGAAKLTAALAAGEPRTLERTESMADGLLTPSVGSFTWPILRRVVREAVQVPSRRSPRRCASFTRRRVSGSSPPAP